MSDDISNGTVRLSGRVICATPADAALIQAHLAEHIRLTRAEPGCVSFEVAQTADPLVWSVEECFTDAAAFEAHQLRTRASDWWVATQHIPRDYEIFGLT
ncbi:putative quinol monooxygenase [Phaeobacter sp. HF9A]|uniref:putative quinol monooxygenase n=1 Tax=Phaeobacter sp. HF9A TaxID=2721561 RepID=UPI00142FC202|nr:antibiotic biosynthesis monooxygenase [Phaeobacter sp. HF9A]NIZ13108.1 antibiotic biosynthesis monooxygenase [Phaeobacter sp. HF9A]